MTKADIVSEIAKKTGVEKRAAGVVVDAFMESIRDHLGNGNHVYLRGFGSFVIQRRAAKVARHIANNTTIHIPEHNRPVFKPAPPLAEAVKATKVVKK